jgi:hypothetical protein
MALASSRTMLPTLFCENDQNISVKSTTPRKHFKLYIFIDKPTLYSIIFFAHLLVESFNEQQAFKSDPTFSHFYHALVTHSGASGGRRNNRIEDLS